MTSQPVPINTLQNFVRQSEEQTVRNDTELKQIFTPEVVLALGDLILSEGYKPKVMHPYAADTRLLKVEQGRKKVIGEATVNSSGELTTIYMAEHKKGIVRSKRSRWASIAGNGSLHSSADDGKDFYIPSLVEEDTIRMYRDDIGERGSPQTGFDMAGEAVRNRSKVLNGFLQTVGSLTKGLITIQQPREP